MSTFDLAALMGALREHPVPLAHMYQLRDTVTEKSGKPNFLFSACRDAEADGSTLADPELAAALTGVALGHWPMGVAAINAWTSAVLKRKPDSILEFGSGISTVVSSILMRRIHGDDQPRVYSVEQGEDAATETRARLSRLGLEPLAKIHIAPVTETITDVFSAPGYDTTEEAAGQFLAGARPEMVLVDGPFGPYGARFSTLPLFHRHLADNAEIWMDDALRDSELSIARWWVALGYLADASMQWTDKGIVRGTRGKQPRHYASAAAQLAAGDMTGSAAEYVLLKMRVQAEAANEKCLKPPFQLR